MRRVLFFGAMIAAALAAPAAQAEPVTIKAAWAAVPGQMFPILMQMKNVLVHYGKSYVVEAVRAPGSGPQTTALASGDLSLAYFAPSAFALAIQNAHMSDLRLIGDSTRDGYEDYYTRQFAVLKDSPIHKVEDLKGKVIGDNSIGGAMDLGMRAMLQGHGLEDKRDYSVVEIEFPNMMATLTAKRVDLGFLTTPFSVVPVKSGEVRVLFTQKQAMEGPSELTVIAARTPYIAANRVALVDYFEDTNRAMRWILDPKNRPAAIQLVADFTKQPASVFSDWIFTKRDDYHAPDSRPNIEAMQKNLDIAKQLGLLKETVDVKAYSDLSLVDEAAARLR
ncbi:MAG TPA: ABC transporter substrate-binding protein [Stellaceae bacterium]|jgi:NitT/TauT family transport system substrate-binding protein